MISYITSRETRIFVLKGVDETSADSGRGDTLATLSGSLMTSVSQSLSSSESNCPPQTSASIDSSSSPSQPEPTPSKVLSLARIFSGIEDATRCQVRPSLRSSQPPQLQTPVRQFVGSTRQLQQRCVKRFLQSIYWYNYFLTIL